MRQLLLLLPFVLVACSAQTMTDTSLVAPPAVPLAAWTADRSTASPAAASRTSRRDSSTRSKSPFTRMRAAMSRARSSPGSWT